jgi:hypothetical protein
MNFATLLATSAASFDLDIGLCFIPQVMELIWETSESPSLNDRRLVGGELTECENGS